MTTSIAHQVQSPSGMVATAFASRIGILSTMTIDGTAIRRNNIVNLATHPRRYSAA